MPRRYFPFSRVLAGAVFGLAAFVPGTLRSQTNPAPSSPVSTAQPLHGIQDRAELEAFLDGFMTTAMADKHVAGATVSVVKDGALFFAKGYGYSDVANRKPVDPERTLFRIGSISKLFTWTAVMQLVEAGKLDLNADVNTYIDFKIPATYPQPITLTNLLTHTPGLEEDSRDLFTTDSNHITPMGKWLPAHMPKRVRPPGTYSSYSNWGTALAGYIVERVSGMKWEEYIEKKILEPLGMNQTTPRQPLPGRLLPDMSEGYAYAAGRFVPKKWEIVTGAAPAGSFSSSATDMAKFMLAHLNNGELAGQRILSDSMAERMHSRLFGHDPRLPGFAHGFYEQSSHGIRIFGHGGDTGWFHSDLALIPSDRVGIFVSFNTNTGGSLSFGPFLEALLDHYYPDPPAKVTLPPDAKEQAARVAGAYQFNRMSYSTYQKAIGLVGGLKIAADTDGTIIFSGFESDLRLVPIGPMLYREELGHTLIAFRTDSSDHITRGFASIAPMMDMERLAWYQAPSLHRFLLALGLAVFLGLVVAAITRFFLRRGRGPMQASAPRPGRRLLLAVALANLIFVVGVLFLIANPSTFEGDTPTSLKIVLLFPVIGVLLALGAAGSAVMQWKNHVGTGWSRFWYSTGVVVALLFAWSLYQWNLLGWRT